MAARIAGARKVIAVDLHENRLQLAQELGATHRISGRAPELVEQLMSITGGGATHALDTTAAPAVLAGAPAALRARGRSDERRVGKGRVSPLCSLLSPSHYKKK